MFFDFAHILLRHCSQTVSDEVQSSISRYSNQTKVYYLGGGAISLGVEQEIVVKGCAHFKNPLSC